MRLHKEKGERIKSPLFAVYPLPSCTFSRGYVFIRSISYLLPLICESNRIKNKPLIYLSAKSSSCNACKGKALLLSKSVYIAWDCGYGQRIAGISHICIACRFVILYSSVLCRYSSLCCGWSLIKLVAGKAIARRLFVFVKY